MNLPCILKTTGGHVICLFENGFGYHMDGCYKGIMTDCKFSIAGSDKNITTEYLANTYGEVKSKEHAEFIVKLAENAGFNIQNDYFDGVGFFYVFKGELTFSSATPVTCAKITIPLPPECEGADEVPDNTDEFDAIVSSKSVGMSEPKKSVNVVMTNKTAAIKVLEALGLDASFVQSVSINGKEVFNIENADDITTVTVSKYVKKT